MYESKKSNDRIIIPSDISHVEENNLSEIIDEYEIEHYVKLYELDGFSFIVFQMQYYEYSDAYETELYIFDNENYVGDISIIEKKYQNIISEYGNFSMSDELFDKHMSNYKTLISVLKSYSGKTIEECKETKFYKDFIKNSKAKEFNL